MLIIDNPFWDYSAFGFYFLLSHEVCLAKKSLFTPRYERLRELLIDARTKAGLTQADVAARLGRHQSFVSKYERGERRLDVVELLEVTDAMGINASKLIERIERA